MAAATTRRRTTRPVNAGRGRGAARREGRAGARAPGRLGFSALVAMLADSPPAPPFLRAQLASSSPHSSGQFTSPRICTSGSSTTPKRSYTLRLAAAITARMSAVVAVPVFSTKLACFGESRAPPIASPPQPAASSSWPAEWPSARGSSGLTKVDPKVLIPEGWASLSPPAHLPHRPLHLGGIRLREREGGAGDHLPLAEVGAAVAEPELVGLPALAARRGGDRHPRPAPCRARRRRRWRSSAPRRRRCRGCSRRTRAPRGPSPPPGRPPRGASRRRRMTPASRPVRSGSGRRPASTPGLGIPRRRPAGWSRIRRRRPRSPPGLRPGEQLHDLLIRSGRAK